MLSPGVIFEFMQRFNQKKLDSQLTIQIDSMNKYIWCFSEDYNFSIRFYGEINCDGSEIDSIIEEPQHEKLNEFICVKFEQVDNDKTEFNRLMD